MKYTSKQFIEEKIKAPKSVRKFVANVKDNYAKKQAARKKASQDEQWEKIVKGVGDAIDSAGKSL